MFITENLGSGSTFFLIDNQEPCLLKQNVMFSLPHEREIKS